MARWTLRDDTYLVEYSEMLGIDFVAKHDLQRSPEAAKRRVEFLKKSGGWDALVRLQKARMDYGRAVCGARA